MRSKFLPLVVIAGLSFGGAAFAGTTATVTTKAPAVSSTMATTKVAATPAEVSGTIKSISTKHSYVVLSNGFKYHVPASMSLKSFKVGEKVSITYSMKGKLHEATAMKAS